MSALALPTTALISTLYLFLWEAGTCLPDVSLLLPLAEVLGTTVTELLRGERITQNLSREETEALVQAAVTVGNEEDDIWSLPSMKPMLWISFALVGLSAFPWFEYSGMKAEKIGGGGQLYVFTAMVFAMLLFFLFGCWVTKIYTRKTGWTELVGMEGCLFAIPLWGAFWYLMTANDIQRLYGHNLRQVVENTTVIPLLIAVAWVVLVVLLHRELLRQWRKHILAEAYVRKN